MKLFSKLTFCSAIALTVGVTSLQAQDARFSQYYASPMRVNPALTGVFEGNWKVGINYRSQWSSVLYKSYKTFGVNAEAKFPVFNDDNIAFSFHAMSDVSGTGNYSTTDVNLGFAYHKKLSQTRRFSRGDVNTYLVAGAQLGFGQRSLKWSELTYSQQWEAEVGEYNISIASGENLDGTRDTRVYPDASAGLMWYSSFGKRRSAYAGVGLYHLNRPDISLFTRPPQDSLGNNIGTAVENLYMRTSIHAGGEILIGGRSSAISLLPGAVVLMQGPSTEINAGLGIRYQAPRYDDFALKMSIWGRFANQYVDPLSATLKPDAIIFIIGLDYQSFQLGLSYDMNVSGLRNASNGRGAMELSLSYRWDADTRRAQGCPSFN